MPVRLSYNLLIFLLYLQLLVNPMHFGMLPLPVAVQNGFYFQGGGIK